MEDIIATQNQEKLKSGEITLEKQGEKTALSHVSVLASSSWMITPCLLKKQIQATISSGTRERGKNVKKKKHEFLLLIEALDKVGCISDEN